MLLPVDLAIRTETFDPSKTLYDKVADNSVFAFSNKETWIDPNMFGSKWLVRYDIGQAPKLFKMNSGKAIVNASTLTY